MRPCADQVQIAVNEICTNRQKSKLSSFLLSMPDTDETWRARLQTGITLHCRRTAVDVAKDTEFVSV